jgi:hypothetical protein
MIKAILALLMAAAACGILRAAESDPPVQPREVRKIYGDGRHNAFTALVRYRGDLWLAFRAAAAHNSTDGEIVILRSADDGQTWKEARRVNILPDDRDPQLLIAGQRLILYDMAMDGPELTTYATYTDDGEKWSQPQKIYEPRFILWKPVAHGGKFFAAAHKKDEAGGGKGREVHLVTSDDGLAWKKISTIRSGNWESETTLLFGPGDQLIAFLRQKYGSPPAQILEADPPYEKWTSRAPNVNHLSGHSVHKFRGTTYFFSRTMDYQTKQAGQMIYTYEDGKLVPYCRLPAGGDCAYAEALEKGDEMVVSYYSSHEGTANVYLARVPLKK